MTTTDLLLSSFAFGLKTFSKNLYKSTHAGEVCCWNVEQKDLVPSWSIGGVSYTQAERTWNTQYLRQGACMHLTAFVETERCLLSEADLGLSAHC